MPWGNRPSVKPGVQPEKELVYVSEQRFREALNQRGYYDLEQVARDIKTYPDTLMFRLRVGSFLPYMAERLKEAYSLEPMDYAPINMVDVETEDHWLTDKEIDRIAEKLFQKIAALIK